MHPDTYINKVLVGTKEGSAQLWNIRNKKLLYTFQGWASEIVCIEQSPAVDVVAFGLKDGNIIVHNIKLDKTLFTLRQDGEVTSISFRTDGSNTMATSNNTGSIAIWELNERTLITVMKWAHSSKITSIKFFDKEPLLLISGIDNSIKIWIFDQADGTARLLRFRSGHSKPPKIIRFYTTSSMMLTVGSDRTLRFFSTVKDQRSREFSQGHIQSSARKLDTMEEYLKLPNVIDFDLEQDKKNGII
jgi:U3 small nucleolar RNA-associated protein 21